MAKEIIATVGIDTDPEHAFYLNPSSDLYTFPATVEAGLERVDFGNDEVPQFRDITNTTVEVGAGADKQVVPLSVAATRAIARQLVSTSWERDKTYDCRAFAWQVSGVRPRDRDNPRNHMALSATADLQPGDLLAVGTDPIRYGLYVSHWAVYLASGIALNVTGVGSILAGTPIENFQTLYPKTSTYVVRPKGRERPRAFNWLSL